MITEPARQQNLMLVLPVAAFFTSLFLLWLVAFPRLLFLPGLVLGIVIGRILAKANVLRGDWGWIIWAAIAVQMLSPLLVFCLELLLPYTRPEGPAPWLATATVSPIALSAGGCFGGLLMVGVLAWRQAGITLGARLARAFLGLVSGGALAFLAWALAPTVGNAVWYVLHSMYLAGTSSPQDELGFWPAPANLVYSLYVVWPTGIAFVMALTLRRTRGADLLPPMGT